MSSLLYPGVNPVVDLVVVRSHPREGLQALLIQRAEHSDAEAGKWALPGGFQNTDAAKNTPWDSGVAQEDPADAAVRECTEETGLPTERLRSCIKLIGVYCGPGRDPRETEERFTQSHAFFVSLDGLVTLAKSDGVFGLDDASQAKWIKWRDLRSLDLAFDHSTILNDAERFIADEWRSAPVRPKVNP